MLVELVVADFLAWRERQEQNLDLDLNLELDSTDLEELKELGFAPTPDEKED